MRHAAVVNCSIDRVEHVHKHAQHRSRVTPANRGLRHRVAGSLAQAVPRVHLLARYLTAKCSGYVRHPCGERLCGC
jgi:hypothetical protein